MADAKAVDAQMGAEKAMSAVASGLAGANMIYESSGMMASLLGASFEAFVLDNEMLSHIYRMVRGIEVNEDTLGFETIRETVKGEGHYLGAPQTLKSMQRDYFYPELADRDDTRTWMENDSVEAWQNARSIAQDILDTHHPDYLTSEAEEAIRSNYPIRL